MGLVTSVAEFERLNAQTGSHVSRTDKNEHTSFQAVFNSKIQSGSESMDAIFEEAAARYDISVDLLKAVAKAESNFNPNAVSKAGAIGVMQLMPATARSLGVADPYDARQNIMGGAKYLKENLERFHGNISFALAAYNAGPNSVQKYGGVPPYAETQNYVKTVTSYMNGSPLYAGKMVTTGKSADSYNLLSGLYSSGLVGSMDGSSYGQIGSLYGTSYSQLANLYGISAGQTSLGGSDALGMLLAASVSEDGETISLSKESYVSLIEMLRLQMMMNASREVGTITI